MSPTVEQMAGWLEDDGHAGCAQELLCASPADRPRVARDVAVHCEQDMRYDDGLARALPGVLREWADGQETAADGEVPR